MFFRKSLPGDNGNPGLIGQTNPRADLLARAENEHGESRLVEIERAAACEAARSAINNRCFNGGNSTHKAEEVNARKARATCTARYVFDCG